MEKVQVNKKEENRFEGNIILFYAYDIGDDVDFDQIRKKNLLQEKLIPLSTYFKNYNIPLSFGMPENRQVQDSNQYEHTFNKLHRFGVLSLCYRIPFSDSLDGLKSKLIESYSEFNKKSDLDAKLIFNKIASVTEKGSFYHLKNVYYLIHITPPQDKISPYEFKEKYGGAIASLLRLEKERLSEYQKSEILSSTTGYSHEDFIIIDSEASFLYDTEYSELLDFLDSANIQQLEMQYYDRLLDERLEYFYLRPFKIPLKAYIPLVGGKLDAPIQKLAKLKVDISVITERLAGSINIAGDAYYSSLYSMLEKQLFLESWQKSINKKLDIIKDMYTVYQDRLDAIHNEILTVVIIVLIGLEAFFAFLK